MTACSKHMSPASRTTRGMHASSFKAAAKPMKCENLDKFRISERKQKKLK